MERFTVLKDGFYGMYHQAELPFDCTKCVIVLGGSEGNEKIPMQVGKMFAERGISALGVCYWNVEGLPDSIIQVPLEPMKNAINCLQEKGFEKIYIYGISKGAELALLCASLMPEISGVIAISPSHCVWGGIKGNGSLLSKSFSKMSEFTWKGEELPSVPIKVSYVKLLKNLLLEQQINMCYLYEDALVDFDETAAIAVEQIKGDIFLIYPENDTMWPSKESVEYIVNRLEKNHFKYKVETLKYEKASHILVPLNPSKLKMFKVERQYAEECKANRLEAFEKTIEWIRNR